MISKFKRLNPEIKEVKKMKKILLILLALVLCASTAQAFWVGDVFNPNEGMVPNVMGFDWSSSGSGLAIDLPPNTVPVVGDTFNFLFQASLVGVTDPNGDAIAQFTNGLNANFEYTVVAIVPEVVAAFTPIPGFPPFVGTALFSTLAGGEFYILYDDPTVGGTSKSVVATGVGFDDGNIAAHGSIAANQFSSFTATGLNAGIGSFIFNGLVDFANALYFDPAIDIVDFRAEGTLNLPPLDSTTAGFFIGPGVFPDYAVTSNDLLFKADASSKFSTVPEPSAVMLLGAGLLGLAGLAWRRK